MRHKDLWKGIDALARRHDLTPSGLARLAGLDATAFNKSKRTSADGSRLRWPSTESLSRALDAVGTDWDEFVDLALGRPGRAIPLVGLARAGQGGYFDVQGRPDVPDWEKINFPGLGDEIVYAIEITGDSMEPVFRAGDRVIVQPGAEYRRGDRIVARLHGGEVLAKELGRMTADRVELISTNPAYAPLEVPRAQIDWIARILWASQ